MTGAVHASIGAGIGRLFKNKGAAFLAGVASHLLTDALPHKDFSPKLEVPLMAGALLAIGKWKGVGSPEFWGAMGALAPDLEHGLLVTGLIEQQQEVFPSHIDDGKLHGRETDERLSQFLLAGASLLALALSPPREDPR